MSKETKWTPGPWVVFGDWGIQDQNNRLIAQFEPLNDDGNGNSEESFANSHLLAAAPELYEALEHILSLPRGTSGRIILELHDEEEVRKALAKAKVRGEQ